MHIGHKYTENVPEIYTFGPEHRENVETLLARPGRACGFDSV